MFAGLPGELDESLCTWVETLGLFGQRLCEEGEALGARAETL